MRSRDEREAIRSDGNEVTG